MVFVSEHNCHSIGRIAVAMGEACRTTPHLGAAKLRLQVNAGRLTCLMGGVARDTHQASAPVNGDLSDCPGSQLPALENVPPRDCDRGKKEPSEGNTLPNVKNASGEERSHEHTA